jgi:hypothetical protein
MTQTSSSSNLYPQATTRLSMAKQDLPEPGSGTCRGLWGGH